MYQYSTGSQQKTVQVFFDKMEGQDLGVVLNEELFLLATGMSGVSILMLCVQVYTFISLALFLLVSHHWSKPQKQGIYYVEDS